MPAKKITQNAKGYWSAAPKITISSIATWDEYEMKWTPKTMSELSENLQTFVKMAKEGQVAATVSAGRGRSPEEVSLLPYKKLCLNLENYQHQKL